MKQIILVNLKSNNARKVINYLESNNIRYFLIDQVKKKIREGNTEFVICGGDGTINQFINLIMKLPVKQKNSITFGIIPCGRANDLARYMKIPLEIESAFKKIKEKNTKKIDVIKVNDMYIVTGGGVGLPSETVQDLDNFSSGFFGKYLKKCLGDLSYLIFTLKKFIFGYLGVEVMSKSTSDKLLAIYILNQPFIGKRFYLAPEAKNDDGLLDIKFVGIPPTFSNHFKTLYMGLKGNLTDLKWVKGKKTKNLFIKLKNPLAFMGDGEIFKSSNIFKIKIIPRAITIFC